MTQYSFMSIDYERGLHKQPTDNDRYSRIYIEILPSTYSIKYDCFHCAAIRIFKSLIQYKVWMVDFILVLVYVKNT